MATPQTVAGRSGTTPSEPAGIPPLENGDRLTRPEFERRYAAMPHVKKAELIEGVVYVTSAVRVASHGEPHARILGWIFNYSVATPGVRFADNTTVRLDLDNEVQPDVALWIDSDLGGRCRVSKDDYLEGAPELVVEVAASSVSYDLHDKLRVYRRSGVQEYVVWRVLERQVDWFRLREGAYVRLDLDAVGVVRSETFPGLNLAVPALLDGDLATVLATLQEGLATPEHARFVEQLQAGRKRSSEGSPA